MVDVKAPENALQAQEPKETPIETTGDNDRKLIPKKFFDRFKDALVKKYGEAQSVKISEMEDVQNKVMGIVHRIEKDWKELLDELDQHKF